jgi:hypothetical protein
MSQGKNVIRKLVRIELMRGGRGVQAKEWQDLMCMVV